MIDAALSLIRNEFVEFLKTVNPGSGDVTYVILENVAFHDEITKKSSYNIVFTLANIEEESTLKNTPALRRNGFGSASYENPPVFLNLYLLVSSCTNPETDIVDYQKALTGLSYVIQFFQGRNSFTNYDPTVKLSDYKDVVPFKVTAELYTMTFEQLNHLWGILGGKQKPSVMYKLRLVSISGHRKLREVPLIEEIKSDLTKFPINS